MNNCAIDNLMCGRCTPPSRPAARFVHRMRLAGRSRPEDRYRAPRSFIFGTRVYARRTITMRDVRLEFFFSFLFLIVTRQRRGFIFATSTAHRRYYRNGAAATIVSFASCQRARRSADAVRDTLGAEIWRKRSVVQLRREKNRVYSLIAAF